MSRTPMQLMVKSFFCSLLVFPAAACHPSVPSHEQASPAPPSPTPPSAEAHPHRSPSAQRNADAPPDWKFKTDGTILAIGDLHGDYEKTLRVFRAADLIDEAHRWTGGTTFVVQVGDQLDRGDGDKAILDFLDALAPEAEKSGGRLIVLNGNHEVMNVNGFLSYATERSDLPFAAAFPDPNRTPRWIRADLFQPGNVYAKLLAKRPPFAIVNKTAFVHGGLTPEHVATGLDAIHRRLFNWLTRGTDADHVVEEIVERGGRPGDALKPDASPFWYRGYSLDPIDRSRCELLEKTLHQLDVNRMVVGHTIQERINSACDGKVWRIDVRLSDSFSDLSGEPHRDVEFLKIEGEHVEPIRSHKNRILQTHSDPRR